MTTENIIKVIFQVILLAMLIWRVSEYAQRYGRAWREHKRRLEEQAARERKRSAKKAKKEKKPFEGLTRQPVCEQCVVESQKVEEIREPPPWIERTRGRPKEVDTERHFCPNKDCDYYGWPGLGNIIANGHPSGGQWRQLQCVVCEGYFQETTGTIFYGSSTPRQDIIRALTAFCESLSRRGVGRTFEVRQRHGPQMAD